ncbi:MAG: protocatechuate 3,4-dioxygenase [Hyphomonadaceae bacterium]|nr:protocatechuate 3,4-dioxygenase [Hyphomonadaceae bacterium]
MIITRRRSMALLSASALAACASDIDRDAAALALTPRETEGPFFPEDVSGESDVDLTRLAGRSARATGQVITVRGRVLDRFGAPITGARVELWQANAAGRYAHSADAGNPAPLDPDFQGYGAITTGADGAFRFTTIRPGGYLVARQGPRTPHLHWKIAAGAAALTTQSYFPGDSANEADFLIRAMGAPAQRLMARDAGVDEAGAPRFDWDVVLAA